MFFRFVSSAVVGLVVAAFLFVAPSPAAAFQQDCGRACSGRTGPSSDSLVSTWTGTGAGPTSESSGTSNCSYRWVSLTSEPGSFDASGVSSDGDVGPVLVGSGDDLKLLVILQWTCSDYDISTCERVGVVDGQWTNFEPHRTLYDCDGDGVADSQLGLVVNELADVDALIGSAFDEIPWPELEVMTTPEAEGAVISGFDIPLRLVGDGAFDAAVVADASENGVAVTATATARTVIWDTGEINASLGYPEEDVVECESFGEAQLEGNHCTVRWRSSSAGQPGDRVTLEATVLYDIVYEINVPGIDVGVDTFELVFERPNFPVAEWQAIATAS